MYKDMFTVEEQIINIGGMRGYSGDMFDVRGYSDEEEIEIEFNFDWIETRYTILIGDYIIMDEVDRARAVLFFDSDEYFEVAKRWLNVKIITKGFIDNLLFRNRLKSKSPIVTKNVDNIVDKLIVDVYSLVVLHDCSRREDIEQIVNDVIINTIKDKD